MVRPGEKISANFPLKVLRDGEVQEVQFRDILTRRTLVSIHMRNNTPSCDRQVDALAALADELAARGYHVVSISRDRIGSHQRYAAKKFPDSKLILASDPEDCFAQAADAVIDKMLYGRKYRGPARAAFVIERDGTVAAVIEKVDTKNHAAEVRAVLTQVEHVQRT